jgi:hypothetical protein
MAIYDLALMARAVPEMTGGPEADGLRADVRDFDMLLGVLDRWYELEVEARVVRE